MMSYKKNLETLLSLPDSGMRYVEVKNVLEHFNLKMRKGKHITFTDGTNRITFPKKGGQIVIKCYLEKIVDFLYAHNYLKD